MNTGSLLTGVGLGAALAFALDPNAGNRRRALMRDQLVRASRKTRDGLDATARDLTNRTRGIAAATRARMTSEQIADDRLLERVRAKLGHATSHPRAIEVTVRDGHVTLRGPVLSREVPRLLMAISNVRGVRSVVNELEAHESSAGIPSLQGSDAIPRAGFRLSRGWSPSAQALAVTGLAATGVWLASRR
jgi:osmotically-inducible protein OsmY